jgi:hypothetical protein
MAQRSGAGNASKASTVEASALVNLLHRAIA